MRTLSAPALEAALAQETDQAYLVLAEITHVDMADPIRVVNSIEPLVSNGDDFLPFPFEIEWPNDDPDRAPEARIRIDNVDRSIVTTIRELQSPPRITFTLVLADSPDTVEMQVIGYSLRSVDWDAGFVTAVLKPEDLVTEPISLVMTPARFPALF